MSTEEIINDAEIDANATNNVNVNNDVDDDDDEDDDDVAEFKKTRWLSNIRWRCLA